MSKSIHTTYKIFKNKSKKEIIEMCDLENPDYKVEELIKKQQIKKEVKIARKNNKDKR
ncbi:hypothetical protein E4N85_04405 [Treponema denticola]|uniref:Uncharacterized protein n=1 Tax=Treponema denticola OTK TaxID=999434 RepID=A0A0F6MS38_TREDN|nr:hypothetical protein [Treponema denticola]EMB19961.1 hypothetical protein HMPREF9724_02410 [Treponema denticola SP37]EMB24539.1 hypothetical protein HMPREF9723_00227 [Treponema denticola OTK]EPF32557.1 hypothetical protein HMPREF9734_02646 [Treponema denticola SP44]EPF40045.1 hypothetical protein HMPREF9731_00655 [Treponema denticola SP23]UTC92459.1 hypothetical protein E4N84_04870 [Treponema denticola]